MERNDIQEAICLEDYYNSYLDCKKHKSTTKAAETFELNALFNLELQRREIQHRKFAPKPATTFIIQDPSIREVWCSEFSDRINHHFMMRELNPYIEKVISNSCYNCREGRGTDKAIKAVQKTYQSVSNNFSKRTYYLKGDFSGFFMSIKKDVLFKKIKELIRYRYKGKYSSILEYLFKKYLLRDITINCIDLSNSKLKKKLPINKSLFNKNSKFEGIEIGILLAQNLCNLYLKKFDDYLSNHNFRHIRYVDDWVVISNSKNSLKALVLKLKGVLDKLNIKVNIKKTFVRNTYYGISFLNKKIFVNNIVLSKKLINRIVNKLKSIKNNIDAESAIIGRKGLMLYYGGFSVINKNILKTLKGEII